MDAGGRAKQEARAEEEQVLFEDKWEVWPWPDPPQRGDWGLGGWLLAFALSSVLVLGFIAMRY